MTTCGQLIRIAHDLGAVALRNQPCFEDACGVERSPLDTKCRAGTCLVEADEEFTRLDLSAVPYMNAFDDSAFEVLNLLALSVDHDGAGRDHSTRQWSGCGPAGKTSEH